MFTGDLQEGTGVLVFKDDGTVLLIEHTQDKFADDMLLLYMCCSVTSDTSNFHSTSP
jgi:hypothetical protein